AGVARPGRAHAARVRGRARHPRHAAGARLVPPGARDAGRPGRRGATLARRRARAPLRPAALRSLGRGRARPRTRTLMRPLLLLLALVSAPGAALAADCNQAEYHRLSSEAEKLA